MSSPQIITCECGQTVFVFRTGHCTMCGEVYASHRASEEEIKQEEFAAKKDMKQKSKAHGN